MQNSSVNPSRSDCPWLDTIQDFQFGRLQTHQFPALVAHVNSCPQCLELLQLAIENDSVTQQLRVSSSLPPDEQILLRGILAKTPTILNATPTSIIGIFHEPVPLLGHFRLGQLLGQGGMGQVYEARDEQLDRLVAVKVMRETIARNEMSRKRFLREARAAASLRHPNVVTIHHVGEESGRLFIVMELLRGESLKSRMERPVPLTILEIVRIAREVAMALHAAHTAGLIHRDIKPENIWLEEPENRIKVLDFGLVRPVQEPASLSSEGAIIGTLAYMAPEQAEGRDIDSRTDLYALGAVLYHLLTGRVPYSGTTPLAILASMATTAPAPVRLLNMQAPDSLSQLVEELLARERSQRPASALAVIHRLDAIQQQTQSLSHRHRHGYLLAAGAAAGLILVTIWSLIGFLTLPKGERSPEQPDTATLASSASSASAFGAARPDPFDLFKHEKLTPEELEAVLGPRSDEPLSDLVGVWGGYRRFVAPQMFGHLGCTKFSPDGRFLATLGQKVVRVFDAMTGQVLREFDHNRHTTWFDYRPDSRAIVVAAQDFLVVWDLQTGRQLRELATANPRVSMVSFTPDGQNIIATHDDGKVRLWDIASSECVRVYEPPINLRYTQAPQIHKDGRYLALAAMGDKPLVRVVDLHSGETLADLPGTGYLNCLYTYDYQSTSRFTPDGRKLAVIRADRAVDLWEVETWRDLGSIEGGGSILNFTTDGRMFRARAYNMVGTIVHIDQRELRVPIHGDYAWADISPDGRTIAVRTNKGRGVGVFDTQTGQERFPIQGHRGPITGLAVSPDGRYILSTGCDHRAIRWDILAGMLDQELLYIPGAYQNIHSPQFSPDGRWIGVLVQECHLPYEIHVWQSDTIKPIAVMKGETHDWQQLDYAFHPKEPTVLGIKLNRIMSWDFPQIAPVLWEKESTDKPIISIAYSPDGSQVVTGDQGGEVTIWNVSQGERIRRFERLQAPPTALKFSPDGKYLAATTTEPQPALYVWELANSRRTCRKVHTNTISGLAWRHDSQALATVAIDGRAVVWPLKGDPIWQTQLRHSPFLRSITFSPTGKYLLLGMDNGMLMAYQIPS